jgi:purine-binding chemotaxis protein CheW
MSDVHVRVAVGQEQYALPVERVEQVVELGELTPVPGAGEHVLGLRNLNGEIVPAVDLGRILRIAHDRAAERLLIVEHQGRRTGLAVNEVIDVGQLTGQMDDHESPFVSATTLVDGAIVGVLAIEPLIDEAPGESPQ